MNGVEHTESTLHTMRRREMKAKTWVIITAAASLFLVGCSMIGPIMSRVEQPDYQVLSSFDSIEIRQYPPIIIAAVEVQGERKESISSGFRLLADYIFGNNTAQQGIAMTAPVQQQPNQKIAMTAPVQQQASGNLWRVSFIMPSEYSLETLPKPNNKAVQLNQIPTKQFIAIRFSGTNADSTVAKYEKQLMQYVETNQIQTVGAPKYAFYNPPWTLPFLRRNEVMVEVSGGEGGK